MHTKLLVRRDEITMLLQMNERKAAEETAKQRKMFEERISQSFLDQAKLKTSLEEVGCRINSHAQRLTTYVDSA